MNAKVWLISWLIIVVSALSVFGYWVYRIDPFFHYHKPEVESYFYPLNNERSQNDGICMHFDYDTLITGTSMAQNFRTSEVDEIFGSNSIKVTFAGGYYKEINDNVDKALDANKNLKTVIRCLDMSFFFVNWNDRRTDIGVNFPDYLYDRNPFNDVEYLLNRDIIFGRAYQMTLDNDKEGFQPGITTFDDYSRWQAAYVFGINSVKPDGQVVSEPSEYAHLTDEEKEIIKKNIDYNVIRTADANPNVDFYYFYSPYSIAYWGDLYNSGQIYRVLEEEAFITELIVSHKNIHLFSFNNRTDIITDLNNYKDANHYATWINSLILRWMHDGKYQLTEENYQDYLNQEYDFYTSFDYSSINEQVDYEADFYAAALLNEELTGVKPLDVLNNASADIALKGAEYITEDGRNVIVYCHGTLARNNNSEALTYYLRDKEYIGIKFTVNMDDGYNYLCFNGQKIMDHGSLTAYVYDESGDVVGKIEANYQDLDNELHQYAIDLSTVKGNVTVILNGGYVDNSGSTESSYQFSNVYMY